MRRTIPRQSLSIRMTLFIASGLLRDLLRIGNIGLAAPFVALASPLLPVPVPARGRAIPTGAELQQR